MTFWICLLCLAAGIGLGLGFGQLICTYMVNATNDIWLKAMIELDKAELHDVDESTEVYENVTVVITDGDISWHRQENTNKITYEEWERKIK